MHSFVLWALFPNVVLLDNVLDNDQLKVDFKPLYQCIHIYTALDALEELQRSYQADRKVCSAIFLTEHLTQAIH